MRISACIPFRARSGGIVGRDERALELVIDNLFAQGIDEVMLHNQGKEPLVIERPNLYHIHVPIDCWRMGYGYNTCATHAIGDIVILTLGGMLLSPGVVEDAATGVVAGSVYIAGTEKFFLCTEDATQKICSRGLSDLPRVAVGARQLASNKVGLGGFCAISRENFLMRIGGYESEHDNWGADDRDFHWRGGILMYQRRRAVGSIYHLCDGFPLDRMQEPQREENRLLSIQREKSKWWRNDLR